jgi:hypothetical protein
VAADAVRLVPAPAADGYYVHADHLGSPQAMTKPENSILRRS